MRLDEMRTMRWLYGAWCTAFQCLFMDFIELRSLVVVSGVGVRCGKPVGHSIADKEQTLNHKSGQQSLKDIATLPHDQSHKPPMRTRKPAHCRLHLHKNNQ